MSRVFRRDGKWWIDFKDANGVRHRKLVGPDKRVAREVLNDILSKVARRVHLGLVEESKISFADFAKLWLDRIGPTLSPRTRQRWEGIVRTHLRPAFPGALRSVTTDQVEGYVARRREAGTSAGALNLEITVLKHIMNRAVKWGHLVASPVRDVRKFEEPKRTRWLTHDEVARLFAACGPENFPHSTWAQRYLRAFVIVP